MRRYTYSEVLCFKYFGWSQKENKRYQQFVSHCQDYQEKLDLKKLVINQGHTNTISSVFMKSYQIKLVSKMGESNIAENEAEPEDPLKIDEAVQQLME